MVVCSSTNICSADLAFANDVNLVGDFLSELKKLFSIKLHHKNLPKLFVGWWRMLLVLLQLVRFCSPASHTWQRYWSWMGKMYHKSESAWTHSKVNIIRLIVVVKRITHKGKFTKENSSATIHLVNFKSLFAFKKAILQFCKPAKQVFDLMFLRDPAVVCLLLLLMMMRSYKESNKLCEWKTP